MNVKSYNRATNSWIGDAAVNCPRCGERAIISGEHANPDIQECGGCGKWFRYWPTGRTAPARKPE